MELHVKRYGELTRDELYDIIRLRIAVFVVEQRCPYMELDGRDREAVHVWLEDGDGIAAYLRVLDRRAETGHLAIGRVISVRRRRGTGSRLMREGIRIAEEYFGAGSISLEAQVYAKPFYEKAGFRQASGEFMEDGIPHILMIRDG